MKKLFYSFILLFAGLAVASCGDDEPLVPSPDPEPEPGVEIQVQELALNDVQAEGMEKTHSFEAPENWRAKSNVDWITVTPKQGLKGDASIALKIAENLSTDEREGELIVETISKNQTFLKITVTQKGREASPEQPDEQADENVDAPDGMKKNAHFLVKHIRVGWNLGNTCESGIWNGWSGNDLTIETNWGNPKTTLAMITALKAAGFNAIRIPTRWYVHADDAMNINTAWLGRVKEIVDYAYSQDMYVILNSHHDNWYDRLPVGYSEAEILARFEKMWTQVASYFNAYDEHLILAGTNEVIRLNTSGGEDWGSPNASNMEMMNKLNQKFVETVRATGGNNAWRCLMVQPWACSPSNALNAAYKLPTDVVKSRLIQEFHCYDPYNYCTGKDNKLNNQWAQHEVTEGDKSAIRTLFAKLDQKFVSAGVPCIMAEFGSTQDNSYSKGNDAADRIRADYHKFIVSEAKKYGIPGFYWDNGSFDGKPKNQDDSCENFGLLDRKTCTFPSRAKIALDGIMSGLVK